MVARDLRRLAWSCGFIVALASGIASWTVLAAPPTKMTPAVATPEDMTAEIRTLLTSIEEGLSSAESYRDRQQQLKRQAVQIAIFSQALADYDTDTAFKKTAPDLRDAALALAKAASQSESAAQVAIIQQGLEGKSTGTAVREIDWSRLANAGAMMGAMKERSEAIRRGLRRPKDPEAESRQALAIALMALVIHGDTHAVKDSADKPAWQEACLELQGHMSRAAAAIKSRDGSAVDHFRMGMEACDKCHQKFKP